MITPIMSDPHKKPAYLLKYALPIGVIAVVFVLSMTFFSPKEDLQAKPAPEIKSAVKELNPLPPRPGE